MCSVALSNIVKQMLNLIQKLQFYGFQIIACNFYFLEEPDNLTRNLRKLSINTIFLSGQIFLEFLPPKIK